MDFHLYFSHCHMMHYLVLIFLDIPSCRIEALNEFDRQRSRRESALNALESFVFDAQGKLWLDEYQAAATEEEIEKIKQTCSEVRV